MSFRLSLVSAPAASLSLSVTSSVLSLLDDLGVTVMAGPVWVAAHRAVGLTLAAALRPDQLSTVRLSLARAQIDVLQTPNVPPTTLKLWLADMDSTMLVGETLDDLAALVGVRDQVADLTRQAMNGSMDYRDALAARLKLLKGTGPLALRTVLKTQKPSPGAATLIATLRFHGAHTVLVSGGFTYYTNPIAKAFGFDQSHGNILDLDDMECVTGQVVGPLIHQDKKLSLLKDYVHNMGLTPASVGAVGDGANDIPMLQAAGFPFAYRPKEAVRDHIANQILYGDLTTILYALGYTPDMFVQTPDPVFA